MTANERMVVGRRLPLRAARVARGLGLLATATGVLALAGWIADLPQLNRALPGTPPMVPLTAVLVVMLGVCVDLVARPARRSRRLAAMVLAGTALAAAATALVEYVFGVDLGTAALLARVVDDPEVALASLHASPQTAQAALLAAAGALLLCLPGRAERSGGQLMGLAVVFMAMVALLGYLLGIDRLYLADRATGVGMSLPTALAFLGLGVGLLLARPESGPVEVATRTTFGGALARQLLLALLLIPIGLGLIGAAIGNLTTTRAQVGLPLFATANLFALAAVVWVAARSIDRLESARRRADAELERAATHDALTGLPNRERFLELLGDALERYRHRPNAAFALLLLDLDRFKLINDSFGHLVGDALLVSVAERVQGALPPTTTLARLSGDEFVALVESAPVDPVADGVAAAESVRRALRAPLHVEGRRIQIAASIGIVRSHPRYRHTTELLRDADIAMYEAKRGGRPWHAYTADLHAQVVSSVELESALRRAIVTDGLQTFYQPIVYAGSRALAGFEALVRWPRGAGDPARAETFVPLAEETGLILDIDRQMLRSAAAKIVGWRTILPRLTLNVNLSPRNFFHGDAARALLDIAVGNGTSPSRLNLELTERGLLESFDGAREAFQQLRRGGARLYLDDFGTGYSSLSYLQRLPVDALKLDRSFTQNLTGSSTNAAFIEAIVLLAKSLDLDVVAEGVETEEQARLLEDLGCDRLQGHLFAPALSGDAADAWVRSAGAV